MQNFNYVVHRVNKEQQTTGLDAQGRVNRGPTKALKNGRSGSLVEAGGMVFTAPPLCMSYRLLFGVVFNGFHVLPGEAVGGSGLWSGTVA